MAGNASPLERAFERMMRVNPVRDPGGVVVDGNLPPRAESVWAPLTRRYPRGSPSDTQCGDGPEHADHSAKFIRDDEIKAVLLHPDGLDGWQGFSGRSTSGSGVAYGFTRYGRAVVQQVGWRGCGAACVAMLTLDQGRTPDWNWVWRCNLTREEFILMKLREAGLGVANYELDRSGLARQLEELLTRHHSGMLSIGGEVGSHLAVLDYFSMTDDLAVVRDPFHGWAVATVASAVLMRHPTNFIGVPLPLI